MFKQFSQTSEYQHVTEFLVKPTDKEQNEATLMHLDKLKTIMLIQICQHHTHRHLNLPQNKHTLSRTKSQQCTSNIFHNQLKGFIPFHMQLHISKYRVLLNWSCIPWFPGVKHQESYFFAMVLLFMYSLNIGTLVSSYQGTAFFFQAKVFLIFYSHTTWYNFVS